MAVPLVVIAASCSTHTIYQVPPPAPPGATSEPSRPAVQAQKPATGVRFTDADVEFMQGMIGHHAQALDMTALVPSRTARSDMKLLALRIEVSQRDEIKMMQDWLRQRGKAAPDEHAHHAPGAKLMPGMLTPDEMKRLAAAQGPAFDRLFLELMIKHHDGALVMVKQLLDTPGAAQEAEVFAFASDVEADQSAEILRMRKLWATIEKKSHLGVTV